MEYLFRTSHTNNWVYFWYAFISATKCTRAEGVTSCTRSVEAKNFPHLCRHFSEWAEVKAVLDSSSSGLIDLQSIPSDIPCYDEKYEQLWRFGDSLTPTVLSRWADVIVIAPLSVQTLGKIAVGLSKDLVTCIVKEWDYRKPFFVAPAMNNRMWSNLFIEEHMRQLRNHGIRVIGPNNGAMAQVPEIISIVRHYLWAVVPRVVPYISKPRILVAATGCIAAFDFIKICRCFSQWGEVRAVGTRESLEYIDRKSFPTDVWFYTDEDEFKIHNIIRGDNVLAIHLCDWADVIVIAPLSANTLSKVVYGLDDNLLTSIIYGWDYSKKPFYVAPAMCTSMWRDGRTQHYLKSITQKYGMSVIKPLSSSGQMADISRIILTVKQYFVT